MNLAPSSSWRLACVVVGAAALSLSLWASILTFNLVLPFSQVFSIINGVTSAIELGLVAILSFNVLNTSKKPFPGLSLVISRLTYVILFAVLVLSCQTILDSDRKDSLAEKSWDHFFRSKDETAIRSVEEGLQCCGFNSLQDRAWPFPSRNSTVDACKQRLGFLVPCAPLWKQQTADVATLNAIASVLNVIVTFLIPKAIPPVPDQDDNTDESDNPRQPLLGEDDRLDREIRETMEEEARRERQRQRLTQGEQV